jgi:hypothetical protein
MSNKTKTKKQKKRHKFLQKMKENWIVKRKIEKQEAEMARREWNRKRNEEKIKRDQDLTGFEGIDKIITDLFCLL